MKKVFSLWPIVLTLVGGICSIAVMKYRVENHETRIVKIEDSVAQLNSMKSNVDLLVNELIYKRRRDR